MTSLSRNGFSGVKMIGGSSLIVSPISRSRSSSDFGSLIFTSFICSRLRLEDSVSWAKVMEANPRMNRSSVEIFFMLVCG